MNYVVEMSGILFGPFATVGAAQRWVLDGDKVRGYPVAWNLRPVYRG